MSLPSYTSAGLTNILYTFPLILTFIILSHNTPDTLFQFFHQLCTLWVTSASSSPSSANVDPKICSLSLLSLPVNGYLRRRRDVHFTPHINSVFFLLIFNPLSAIALLHSSSFLSTCSPEEVVRRIPLCMSTSHEDLYHRNVGK